ncbi:MAG: hypothetical protein AVDCRST_MAG37-1480 [uncultured Rubrobacteraceae bacterium]|uniref:PASTA domain-containing protein n=1 Tax=uncultured Rubrobacteraceae bacterium TaxID=349277 RepID=A0A6J4QHJ3_9ACTN|nr:MAG: hypothetical protein AVDCRST_MAG37-1480 [uncultured Rubrobacteraceae bacterium]
MGYTVDEVSEVLEIPGPTLYRYLREYSIPHERRAGKISIPEESLERIREARELHKEGLGTTSVRQRLKQTGDVDTKVLTERLDRLCGKLENLHLPQDAASPGVLREILEGQRSLTLAVHRLTERVEDILAADSTVGRLSYSDRPEERVYARKAFPDRFGTEETLAKHDRPGMSDYEMDSATDTVEYSKARVRRVSKFGDMSRKRRRNGALALLLALMLGGVLIWGLASWGYSEGDRAQASSIEPANTEEPEAGDQEQSPATVEAAQEVGVPSLAGLTFPQAKDRLAEAGLEPGERAEVESIEIPTGTVITQYPASGEAVEPGSGVKLLFSSGPPMPEESVGEPVPPSEVPGGALNDGSEVLPYQEEPYQGEVIPQEPFRD